MSEQPTVCCVMLTRDRPELAAKAVECFRRQTYENKHLLAYNNGQEDLNFGSATDCVEYVDRSPLSCMGALTIGDMRNKAIRQVPGAQIIIHWDDDDWSHPNRIAEQVAFLQMSGADVVGYNQMLFWRDPPCKCDDTTPHGIDGSGAWLYTAAAGLTPALGTSLCYWRKTWERKPFNPALPKASGGMSEETEFLRGLKCVAIGARGEPFQHVSEPSRWKNALGFDRPPDYLADYLILNDPRMIARIHGSNFGKYDIENQIARGCNAKPGEGWARVPEWDDRVREILA